MNTGKSFKLGTVIITVSILLAACAPATATPAPSKAIEVKNITEIDQVAAPIIQKKQYDQCDSASPLKTEIKFSESSSEAKQKELVLSAGASSEIGISAVAKVELEGSVQQRFSSVNTTSKDYQEVLSIEVPARTHQEYTITWRETRREGTIEYVENGVNKSANYSYRIGLELASSNVKDLGCTNLATILSPTPEPTATEPPPVKTLADGCLFADTWTIDSTDTSAKGSTARELDGCYSTGSLGIYPDKAGVLHIFDQKRSAIASGIYTPIRNDSVIEFRVHVTSMYLVYPETPTYISFAVAPATDPMDARKTARFKLHVEKTDKKPVIFYMVADPDESVGVKVGDRHYEYGNTYTIRFELTGSVMNISINGTELDETLSIPAGPKVFYIGYNLPLLAGVNVEVTDISIDGIRK
jgi:hypothetical protein